MLDAHFGQEGSVLWWSPRRGSELRIEQCGFPDSDRSHLFIEASSYLSDDFATEPPAHARLSGIVREIGFTDGWSRPLVDRPPRTRDIPSIPFCHDRSLHVTRAAEQRSLARIGIAEALVRDEQLRADLDFTGFRVSVTLRDDAFRVIQAEFAARQEPGAKLRSTRFILCVPSRAFRFPTPRGNPELWDAASNLVGRLRPIRTFSAEALWCALLDDVGQDAATDAPLEERYRARPGRAVSLKLV